DWYDSSYHDAQRVAWATKTHQENHVHLVARLCRWLSKFHRVPRRPSPNAQSATHQCVGGARPPKLALDRTSNPAGGEYSGHHDAQRAAWLRKSHPTGCEDLVQAPFGRLSMFPRGPPQWHQIPVLAIFRFSHGARQPTPGCDQPSMLASFSCSAHRG